MSAWAIIDQNQIIVPSILCGEHAHQPDVLDRHWKQLQDNGVIAGTEFLGWVQLPTGDDVLAKDCNECHRLAAAAAQPVLPGADDAPSPTSPVMTEEDPAQPICPRCGGPWGQDITCNECTDTEGNPRPREEDPEQGQAEEAQEYVHEKMDGVAPEPWDVEILSKEDTYREHGEVTEWVEPMVTLKFGVEERIWYPAEVMITRRRYENMLEVFPQLKRHNLPLGLILRMAKAEDATVVYNERRSDIQGQSCVGPVEEGDSDGHE